MLKLSSNSKPIEGCLRKETSRERRVINQAIQYYGLSELEETKLLKREGFNTLLLTDIINNKLSRKLRTTLYIGFKDIQSKC